MRIKPSIIIKTLKKNCLSVLTTSKQLGINRSTVYRWIKRARTYGKYLKQNLLKRNSTRPKTVHYALTPQEQSAIILLRREKGYTAQKIKKILRLSVSWLTIHRLMKRKGLINKYGEHRRPRLQETIHMHAKNVPTIGYLQMDVKYITPELSGLPWTCFEYAIIDIYSRYKEAVILNQLDPHGAIVALLEILPKLPFRPVFIQTDNGLEFQGIFHETVIKLGLKHHYIHKRTPNENALIERSFRTDEEEFFFYMKKSPKHYDELRDWFAEYLKFYNEIRPHLALNLKTPLEVVKLSQMS